MSVHPYEPETLPLDRIDWVSHIPSIGEANRKIARYDGILRSVVNPRVLLAPIMTQEAVVSSRIEGTQASLEDVLHYEADPKEEISQTKRDDIQEILNYRKAMMAAVGLMGERPLCINTIRELHRTLLFSVRGQDKEPGEIRRIQNYIAPYGRSIEEATFVPPAPPMVWDALTNWENYLHSREKDALVQVAILKAQFELIHPFRDGNGRIGRMLVPLTLFSKGVISTPMFYISAYLERHREVYYARLRAVSEDGDWNGWIAFFLRAICEQADENGKKALDIISLYNEMKQVVPEITHSQYSIQAIDAIFSHTIFSTSLFIRDSGIQRESGAKILRELEENDVIQLLQRGRGSKPNIYAFSRLIAITEGNRL